MVATIAVGVDGSPESMNALHWASTLATPRGDRLLAVMAWQYPTLAALPFPGGYLVPPPDAMQADAEDQLAVVLAAAADASVDVAESIVQQGSSGPVVCAAAEGADLLVIGTRGLGSVKGMLLGSVGGHCVHESPCSVAIVPDNEAPTTGVVMVGVDGSAASEAAIDWADEWVPASAQIVLVHAWNIPLTWDSKALGIDTGAVETASKAMLEAAANRIANHEVDTLLVRGDARTVLEERAGDADMVVVGAHRHSAPGRILMGSVATYASHHVRVPTVIVR